MDMQKTFTLHTHWWCSRLLVPSHDWVVLGDVVRAPTKPGQFVLSSRRCTSVERTEESRPSLVLHGEKLQSLTRNSAPHTSIVIHSHAKHICTSMNGNHIKELLPRVLFTKMRKAHWQWGKVQTNPLPLTYIHLCPAAALICVARNMKTRGRRREAQSGEKRRMSSCSLSQVTYSNQEHRKE